MELINPQEIEAKVEARFRVFLILWVAILGSVGMMSTLVVVLPSQGAPNPTLSYCLLGVGIMMVAMSFVLKQNLARKAIDKNDIAALQSAHIVALALSESAAVFGLVVHFTSASIVSWLLLAISVAGIVLNFPSKNQIRAVLFKSQ